MSLLLSLFLSLMAMADEPTHSIVCDYLYMGVPFSRVEVAFYADGTAQDFSTITVQGRSHRESFSREEASATELLHGWISKESSENSIEMVVYREAQKEGRSKIVNNRLPFGKEIWGNCTF